MTDDELKAQWDREERPRRYAHDTKGWLKSPFYCVSCGKQDCWQNESGGDDYYTGSSVTCKSCGHQQSCMPSWYDWKKAAS